MLSGPGPAVLAAQTRFYPNRRNHQVRRQETRNISCAMTVQMF
jgi:hypothetical protein